MAPVARRASARLQNRTPQLKKNSLMPASASKLSSLVERDETPDRGVQSVLNSIAASAPAKPASLIPRGHQLTTPSATRIRPSPQDMHPSRHQSTAKKLDSARRIGLANVRALTQSPSNNQTPTEVDAHRRDPISPPQNPFSSPSFDFRFTRPSTDLSSEAQRMMDEVREQAAKIKMELAAQRTLQAGQDEPYGSPGRRVVNAKGKIGRFSDVHMEQFRKMNSIADHPSALRAGPLRSSPLAKSLKRSNSKAGLDKLGSDLTRSPSTKFSSMKTRDSEDSPAKRRKTGASIVQESTKSPHATRKKNSAEKYDFSKSKLPTVPTAISTPTKSSLARSSSARSLTAGRSMIPSLNRSPSKILNTPQALKPAHPSTESKALSSFASKLTSVKSILRRPQLKFSDDPVKLAAGTHIATPDKAIASTGDTALSSLPQATPGSAAHRKEKRVNFSSSPVKLIPSSPLPSPSPTKLVVQYPVLPSVVDDRASPTDARTRVSTVGPSDFTFRADRTITFAQPNQATPTIRRVRASEPAESPAATVGKFADLPGVPHGLSNKKRKHELSDDDDDDVQNKENNDRPQEVEQSPAKRARTMPAPQPSPKKTPTGKLKTPTKKRVPDSKRRGILSLSRLNALARPKQRG